MNQIASAAAMAIARAIRFGCPRAGSAVCGTGRGPAVASSPGRRGSGSAMIHLRQLLSSLTGERGGTQDLVDLRVGEDVLLTHELENALAGLERFGSKLRRFVVADHWVERRDSADARL